MKTFVVVLSTGSEYVLATDSEHAAWQALELAQDRNVTLIDVRPYVNFDW
jgi:hypothetical protein